MADSIHKGHRQRMRKKFMEHGFSGFESHEILEMLLYYSIPRGDTNKIAHDLINTFHSFAGVCDADINDLMSIEGIGESSAILIKMIPLFSREYMSKSIVDTDFKNLSDVCSYFKTQFIGEKTEKIRIVCLNDKLKFIAGKIIAEGSPGKVSMEIRPIIEFTYQNKCKNIILAHNHPNGIAAASNDDIRSTEKIYKTLKSVGIDLLDHIIVADNNAISLKETSTYIFMK